MAGLKTIYSKDGNAMTDISAAITRSSLLNEIGEAVFYIPTDSPKCRAEYLNYGNFLYIQNDTLPDWVGMIDTPRLWHNGYVECHAYEVPYLLQYRLPLLNQVVEGTPGQKITAIINAANARVDTLLRVGSVYSGGIDSTEVLADTCYTEMKNISTRNSCEWLCTPNVDASGRLTVIIDILESGATPSDLELLQGYNIMYGETPLEESGELINSAEGVATIEGETESSQITAQYYETASYGLREARVTFDGVTNVDTLLKNCTALVKEKISPSFGAPITAVNVGNTFSNIKLRNAAKYKYSNVGFTGGGLGTEMNIKINGYLFNEAVGTCELYTGKIE